MRPKIKRHICKHNRPKFSLFKPNGVPTSELNKTALEKDEFEAVRLVDMLQLSQQDAAVEMQVSRQTFANILKSSRHKITTALVQGNALLLNKDKEEQ
ncbi:hypothetical protein CW745_10055 [Psychromonas sp. psych-6C06]|uniref:DUF134 domain-containing protein n=1 Tax=Psychromonas sp. psych-6C06 TaxID=2058089 RepID=UPI000C32D169|nr:DUF134 domain-containing protein [Psychromonas sp. psych-6C06]PKF61659.1 hypothetical protein CW745_10055 [Psychromonas sp. psych-6C06]